MVKIFNGKKVSNIILDNLKKEVMSLSKKPKLAVILVGDNPASKIYVRIKQKVAKEIGYDSVDLKFPSNVPEEVLVKEIEKLNEDETVNAILVQLPLPDGLDKNKILNTINPKKDVDGFHYENVGKLTSNQKPYATACTARGILELLEYYDINVSGKAVTVIGRSNLVGTPVARLLQNNNATVTVCHSKTKNITKHTKNADIIICAIGQAKFLKADMVNNGAIVIDVGINKIGDKIVGDTDFEKLCEVVSAISPVPNGVGPMTIAGLMQNTLDLYKLQNTL